MKVLISGGCGYIGNHIAWKLRDAGHTPIIIDDFSTGSPDKAVEFVVYKGDIGDTQFVSQVLVAHPEIAATIHCAARIVVPESVKNPVDYYENNFSKSLTFLNKLLGCGYRKFVFSGTASIYENNATGADENTLVRPLSPYARSKYYFETALRDISRSGPLEYVSLRYFNPIGADSLLRTGHVAINPTHLLGSLVQAALSGKPFRLTGASWPTRDGTALRDYIDINDLAQAHVTTIELLVSNPDAFSENDEGMRAINIGSGDGTTVLEFVNAFRNASNTFFDVERVGPREGDTIGSYCLNKKAKDILNWSPSTPLAESIRSALAWARKQPQPT